MATRPFWALAPLLLLALACCPRAFAIISELTEPPALQREAVPPPPTDPQQTRLVQAATCATRSGRSPTGRSRSLDPSQCAPATPRCCSSGRPQVRPPPDLPAAVWAPRRLPPRRTPTQIARPCRCCRGARRVPDPRRRLPQQLHVVCDRQLPRARRDQPGRVVYVAAALSAGRLLGDEPVRGGLLQWCAECDAPLTCRRHRRCSGCGRAEPGCMRFASTHPPAVPERTWLQACWRILS